MRFHLALKVPVSTRTFNKVGSLVGWGGSKPTKKPGGFVLMTQLPVSKPCKIPCHLWWTHQGWSWSYRYTTNSSWLGCGVHSYETKWDFKLDREKCLITASGFERLGFCFGRISRVYLCDSKSFFFWLQDWRIGSQNVACRCCWLVPSKLFSKDDHNIPVWGGQLKWPKKDWTSR